MRSAPSATGRQSGNRRKPWCAQRPAQIGACTDTPAPVSAESRCTGTVLKRFFSFTGPPWKRLRRVNATSITNGSLGIKGIPGEATLLTCYIWTVITLVVLSRLIFSNFGNVLRCIRDNEIAAGVMGINVFRYKVLSFCVGAFFAGVGGALLGSHLSTIDPKMFNFLLTFNVLMFVVAGGLGSLTGSLLGATIVTILLEWLRAIEEPMDFGVFEIPGIPGMRMVVFSLILLAIILFRREGIMGTREITWKTIFSLGRRKA